MTYEEIVRKVAKETGYDAKFVNKVYKAYWQTIRTYIKSLPLKEDLTDEEFMKLRPNVNIPSLGKLNVTLQRYRNMKKHNQIVNEIKARKHDRETEEGNCQSLGT